jgi:hypothetical protein
MSLILDGTNGLSDVDGSASTPAIRGTDTNTGIFFPAADTIAFAEGGAEVARFDSNGNLGIGTSSPTNKLEVNGIVKLTPITYSDTPSSSYGGFLQGVNDGSLHVDSYNPTGNSFLAFGTNASSAAIVERMRINSSGDVLIGTTSTDGKLNVSYPSGGNGCKFVLTNSSAASNVIVFNNTNGTVGFIQMSGSNTSYNTSSDYRLKENIAPMTGALATVSALKPVTYTWKTDGSNGQGFIAHELQAVVPDCVTGEKDAVDAEGNIKAQAIDTSFLVATLTAAIQEQQAIITDLKARLEILEAK